MKRILVTGGRGFIGRQALPQLVASEYDVHAVTSQTPPTESAGVTWHVANLLEPGSAERVAAAVRADCLLHLAWYAEPGKFWSSELNREWVRASSELFREFHRAGGARVVAAGTCAEYDWSDGHCSENETPLHPRTLYGQAKLESSDLLRTFARQHDMTYAWGRVFFLYGPHEHPARLVASVVGALLRGQAARVTHGKQVRDFLHVADVAGAFAALAGSTVTGPVNIASGVPLTVRAVVEAIAAKLGRPDLLELGALPAPADDPPRITADVRRLRTEVNWIPRYDLDSGLDDTIAWWRAA